jgi:hypothetical protein
MILEYDEFCMFLLNIEVFNIMTLDFPYTSDYLFPCYISIKNKDMFPGEKKVRGLERHPDIYPFWSISFFTFFNKTLNK